MFGLGLGDNVVWSEALARCELMSVSESSVNKEDLCYGNMECTIKHCGLTVVPEEGCPRAQHWLENSELYWT